MFSLYSRYTMSSPISTAYTNFVAAELVYNDAWTVYGYAKYNYDVAHDDYECAWRNARDPNMLLVYYNDTDTEADARANAKAKADANAYYADINADGFYNEAKACHKYALEAYDNYNDAKGIYDRLRSA